MTGHGTGHDRTGAGQDMTEQDRTGKDWTGQDGTGQKTEQGTGQRTGQGIGQRTGDRRQKTEDRGQGTEDRTGQDRTGQDRTGQQKHIFRTVRVSRIEFHRLRFSGSLLKRCLFTLGSPGPQKSCYGKHEIKLRWEFKKRDAALTTLGDLNH